MVESSRGHLPLVRIVPEAVPYWHLGGLWFIISMNAWNMPMFFFLSGIR